MSGQLKMNDVVRTNLDKDSRLLRIVWVLFCVPMIGYDKDDNVVFTGSNLLATVVWVIIISLVMGVMYGTGVW